MSDSLNHPIAQLAAFRELTPAERQAVQEHLAVCDECRAQFEAFRRQDALLSMLPTRLPRRQLLLTPRRAAGLRQGVAWLGNLLAVSGTVTAAAALAILVYVAASAPAQTGSAPIAPGLPIKIPDDLPMRVNPWVLAAPWIGGAVAVAGLLFALGRRSRKWSLAGVLFSLTLVFGFVQPLSALPNPVGIIWRVTGGYSYDPNLPFVNWWIVRGDPIPRLQPYMNRMIGQMGLDPLDPVQPLARYHFERVIQPRDTRFILVRTRFVYADGSTRVYDVPMAHPYVADFGYLITGWLDDGMQRLRAQHLALEGQPFATGSSPVHLDNPTRLKLSPQAERLDATNPTQWLWLGNRMQRLVWSPQGDAFLMIEHALDNTQQLWLVPLDGSASRPKLVHRGSNVFEYDWSPDGQFIVYTVPGQARGLTSSARTQPLQLIVARRESPEKVVIQRDITNASRLPSLTRQGIWYAQDNALWLVDYQTGQATRVTALPDYGLNQDAWPTLWPVAVSPDAARVAYACENDLCVMDLDGGARRVIPATGIRAITWDRTGARLAAVSLDWNNLGPVRMLIISREGQVQQDTAVAPRDATETPQWTPDGKIVFVQTYPMNGRRILTVNADTGQVLDLSREHWDTYFALSPDGKSLLLNNGRGGFWLAPIVR